MRGVGAICLLFYLASCAVGGHRVPAGSNALIAEKREFAVCHVLTNRSILSEDEYGRTIVWRMENSKLLYQPLDVGGPEYEKYVDWVRSYIRPHWKHLLDLEKKFLLSELKQPPNPEVEDPKLRPELLAAEKQIEWIEDGLGGTVHSINCLERFRPSL